MNDVCPTDQYTRDIELSTLAHTEPDAFKVKISQRDKIFINPLLTQSTSKFHFEHSTSHTK